MQEKVVDSTSDEEPEAAIGEAVGREATAPRRDDALQTAVRTGTQEAARGPAEDEAEGGGRQRAAEPPRAALWQASSGGVGGSSQEEGKVLGMIDALMQRNGERAERGVLWCSSAEASDQELSRRSSAGWRGGGEGGEREAGASAGTVGASTQDLDKTPPQSIDRFPFDDSSPSNEFQALLAMFSSTLERKVEEWRALSFQGDSNAEAARSLERMPVHPPHRSG